MTIVATPSIYLAAKNGMRGVAVLDCVALSAVLALVFVKPITYRVRAAAACTVFYVVGAGLMMGVGSISMIYLCGFSIMTTLFITPRWGMISVALSTATMLAIGYFGLAFSKMVVPTPDVSGWTVITANFAFVNLGVVLAVGAVIRTLEHERRAMVTLNASLHEQRALLRIAGLTARLGGWRVVIGGTHVEWSDEVCTLHEVPAGTSPTLDVAVAFYAPDYRALVISAVGRCATEGVPFDVEAEIISARDTRLWVRVIGNASRNELGALTHVHGSIQDITAQKLADARQDKLEAQLRQAQKMETIGSLAGGVAHDFNNLLTVVLSYSEMLAEDLRVEDPMRAGLEQIRLAGLRATELTRQLLAFSRRQVLAPKLLDLSATVAGMERMLQRLIGEDVEISVTGGKGLGNVLVDPGQLEQVIMNLAVNARDAMPRGGMLTIETAAVILDADYASEHVGVTPGPHVMLAISDTGTGMDKATQERMFEPFFTTKEQGKGTGLGLATVFGIVQQSGGSIWVYSELGRGTTFKVYFPIADEHPAGIAAATADRPPLRGSETILLVEDEDSVRTLARTILRRCGYTVLEAANGGEALLLSEQHTGTIDLLLTDVVMPRVSGRQLAEKLQPLRPAMKVIFMSGYTDDAIVRHGILHAELSFLQKPITPASLSRKIRETLDR
ncbi:hypothetical protein BH11MYX3_BH11MYX3_13960 [soil metagenome]